jgi:site-specific DNA-cytosine methylase
MDGRGTLGWKEGDDQVLRPVTQNSDAQMLAIYRKSARARSAEGYETWEEDETTNTLNQFDVGDVRTTTAIVEAVMGDVSHTLTGEGCDASEDGSGRGTPVVAAYQCHGTNVGPMGTLRAGDGGLTSGVPFLVQLLKHLTIRRITPLEALRLQGFPDHWLDVSGKPLSDTTKYRQIGNAVAVPCVEWIARRMVAQEGKTNG